MSFNSLSFLVFFPVVVLIYFVLPQKIKYIWLLIASYYFYMSWNAKYALLIAFSTLITYLSGIFIEKYQTAKAKKTVVALSFIINLSILFFFKYFDFALENVNLILGRLGMQIIEKPFDVLLPVGISFYTFQALSYTMDVYRGELKPEKNFFKYALFVSFFPQLVAGPIERSKNLVSQISEEHYFDGRRVVNGLLLMLYGLFMKLILADRLSILVDSIFDNYTSYSGLYIVVAAVAFGLQIYCDFGSYSNIAIGAAEVMGFGLMQNFRQPYLATTVADFWRRWHISLTSWFRDYLYIPLGGNKKGKVRKYINIMIVFLLSGLWHGASWSFVVWGGLNGMYQIIGDLLRPVKEALRSLFHLNKESFSHRVLQQIITFILVDFAWIFFRAGNMETAVNVIKGIFTIFNPWIFFDGKLCNLGLDVKDMNVLVIGLLLLLLTDILNEMNICIRDFIFKQDLWFRWVFYITVVMLLMIFGIYGPSYSAADFIYFQF